MEIKNRLSNKICPEGMTIEEWQVALRREQAEDSDFVVEHMDDNRIWGDYIVSSGSSAYKAAFRGVQSDKNYCSCLDFRTNGLGTCKHLEAVILYLQAHEAGYPWAGLSYNPPYSSIYVSYKGGRSIRMRIGQQNAVEYLRLQRRYFDEEGVLSEERYEHLSDICREGRAINPNFRCYEDVETFAQERVVQRWWQKGLRDAHLSGRLPIFGEVLVEEMAPLEHLLFDLVVAYNGLLVSGKHSLLIPFVLRLIAEIYRNEQENHVGYIVVSTEVEQRLWERELESIGNGLSSLPIEVVTANQFIDVATGDHPPCTFVYIDEADGLKGWKNPLSIALKRLTVEHLYMRVHSLDKLTPIQLTSILQHISPFVIGPLYRFVHSYRPIFPLKDSLQGLPSELEPLLFSSAKAFAECEALAPYKGGVALPKEKEGREREEILRDVLEGIEELLRTDEGVGLLRAYIGQILTRK